MKKPADKNVTRLFEAWKAIVRKPATIRHEGPLSASRFIRSRFQASWTKDGELSHFQEEKEAQGQFYAQNLRKFVQLGMVFVGKHLACYPWRYCDPGVAIPVELAVRMLDAEFGVRVTTSEIRDLKRLDLLPNRKSDSLPLFAKDRIIPLRECRGRLGYTDSHLKQLVEYEEQLLEELRSWGISYDECDCLNLRAKRKESDSGHKTAMMRSRGVKRDRLKSSESRDYVLRKLYELPLHFIWRESDREAEGFLAAKKAFGDLSPATQVSIRSNAELKALLTEDDRRFRVNRYWEKVLAGFSPQIDFDIHAWTPVGDDLLVRPLDLRKARIDWKQSQAEIVNRDLGFVRTPDFIFEPDQEGRADIGKIDLRTLDSDSVRKALRNVAAGYRKKLGIARREHGSASKKARQSKAQRAERNNWLKKHYRELRTSKPSVSAERLFDILQGDLLKKEEWDIGIREIDISTIKRIVYRGS